MSRCVHSTEDTCNFYNILDKISIVQNELRQQYKHDIDTLRQNQNGLVEGSDWSALDSGSTEILSIEQDFAVGDKVKIIKESRLKGKTAIVVDANWNGMVKVNMDEDDRKGRIKSFKPRDLEPDSKEAALRQRPSQLQKEMLMMDAVVDVDDAIEEGLLGAAILRDKVPIEVSVEDRQMPPSDLHSSKGSEVAELRVRLSHEVPQYLSSGVSNSQLDSTTSKDFQGTGTSVSTGDRYSGSLSDEQFRGKTFFIRDVWYDRIDLLKTKLQEYQSESAGDITMKKANTQDSATLDSCTAMGPTNSTALTAVTKKRRAKHHKGPWVKEGRPPPACMIHPSSWKTLAWGCFSLCLLAYDLAMVPVELCFPLEPTTLTDVIQFMARLFWTFDMVLSFFIGVVHHGQLMMQPRNVARVYMQTWFPFDICVIIIEWASMLLESTRSPVSTFRVLRWSRMVRLFRVVRFIKFQKIRPYMRGLLVLTADGLNVTYALVRATLFLVVAVHINACLWHLVGDTLHNGWVEVSGLRDATVVRRYAMSLHWQFKHGQLEHGLFFYTNYEFVIDSFLLLGNVCFGVYYTGVMVNLITTWCHSPAARMAVVARSFTRRYGLSYNLVDRIHKFLSASQVEGPFEILAEDQRLKHSLPLQLQEDINFEIRSPSLNMVSVFKDFQELYPRLVRNLCQDTLTEEVCVDGDIIFGKGDVCIKMFFFTSGMFKYYCSEKVLSKTPRSIPRSMKSGNGFDVLTKGHVAAEAVLWTTWNHFGDMHSVHDAYIISMEAEKFSKSVISFTRPTAHAVKYAKHFTWVLNRSVPSDIMSWNVRIEDLDVDLFIGGLEDHFVFISHYKVEAGTEATLMRSAMKQWILRDPTNPVADFKHPIFIDSEDLVDLDTLINHVKGSLAIILLLTPGLLSRPWCLLEIVTAKRHRRPFVPVHLQRPGLEFKLPDERFYAKLHRDEIIVGGAEGRKLLESNGTTLKEVEEALRSVFRMIALPYSPHKSAAVRDAEVQDILKRCMLLTTDSLKEQINRALSISSQQSFQDTGSMNVCFIDHSEDISESSSDSEDAHVKPSWVSSFSAIRH